MCKGNIKAQRKRRRKALKQRKKIKPLADEVQLIDGNYTLYPVAYCKAHSGYLTQGLMDIHRCEKRICSALRKGDYDGKYIQTAIWRRNDN